MFAHVAEAASFGTYANLFLALTPVHTSQLWHGRREILQLIVTRHFHGPIKVLEVGTWFGVGSTRVWFDNIPNGSSLTLVDSWRAYISNTDLKEGPVSTAVMDALPHSAIMSTLKEVYRIEAQKRDLDITVARGKSSKVLSQLKEESFDLIYIDGSHYYEDVKLDIQMSKRLVKGDFAIICGDDYEEIATEDYLVLAREHLERDYVQLPNGNWFHPGVMLAVAEEFERVNMKDGIWWVYCRHGQFRVDLA